MVSRRRFLELASVGMLSVAGCSSNGGPPRGDRPGGDSNPTNQTGGTGPPVGDGSPTPTPTNRWLDILEFGAEVDGRTDDTAAVRDAIAAADHNDTVFFPPGVTVVSGEQSENGAAIALDGDSIPEGLTLAGLGRDSVVRVADDQPRYHKTLYLKVNSGFRDFTIRNLRLDGNKQGQTIKPGSGGHGIMTDDANSPSVPVEIRLRNVWIEDFNMTGVKPLHGGFTMDRCTVTGCVKHGAAPDSTWDVQKFDPPILFRHCYFANNGLEGTPVTYGIDCSGGKIVVEDTVCEGNAQGTKTTEGGIEITYRRVRLKDNDVFGYIRAGRDGQDRTKVTFEDVVSSGNGQAGFRLSKDTDYTVPTEIVTTHNNRSNLYITENAWLDAATVWASESRSGFGIFSNSSRGGHIENYHPHANADGPASLSGNLEIEDRDPKTKTDIEGVPTADEVGAGSLDFPDWF